jgi:general secretion pathway protein J
MRRSAEHGFTSLRRSAEHGFTLVEVMIALMIFGMIAAAGVAILSFSVRAQGATNAKLDQVSGIARLNAALAADLAQAQDRPARDERGVLRPAFTGEPQAITLVRGGWSNFDGAPRASVQKAQWRLEGGAIVRQGWPMLDGAPPLDPAAIVDHVRSLAFRYRVAGAWIDRWQGADGVALPQAVELTLVRDDGVRFRQLFYVGEGYRPDADDE